MNADMQFMCADQQAQTMQVPMTCIYLHTCMHTYNFHQKSKKELPPPKNIRTLFGFSTADPKRKPGGFWHRRSSGTPPPGGRSVQYVGVIE